jgi:hypothetical protein
VASLFFESEKKDPSFFSGAFYNATMNFTSFKRDFSIESQGRYATGTGLVILDLKSLKCQDEKEM